MVRRQVSAYRALASESRISILHMLQGRDTAATVEEVATEIGLHINTVREHLDRLVATGFVASEPEVRTTRGRPRLLYRSVERAAAATLDDRARDHLARLLLEGYGRAVADPGRTAEEAGRTWVEAWHSGVSTVRRLPGDVPHDARKRPRGIADDDRWAQLAALETHFEDLGFDPELDVETMQIRLARCPFLDLARQRTEVVCSVHLGIARGVLARVEGPLRAERLDPFTGPRLCVLQLAESADTPTPATSTTTSPTASTPATDLR